MEMWHRQRRLHPCLLWPLLYFILVSCNVSVSKSWRPDMSAIYVPWAAATIQHSSPFLLHVNISLAFKALGKRWKEFTPQSCFISSLQTGDIKKLLTNPVFDVRCQRRATGFGRDCPWSYTTFGPDSEGRLSILSPPVHNINNSLHLKQKMDWNIQEELMRNDTSENAAMPINSGLV